MAIHVKTTEDGRKVEVIVKDDASTPDQTRRLAQELVVNDKVVALAGFGITPSAMAVAPIATQSKTPMVFVLKGGETLHGVIEWYDKTCLKINRTEGPNLLVYKHNIQYMYKAEGE